MYNLPKTRVWLELLYTCKNRFGTTFPLRIEEIRLDCFEEFERVGRIGECVGSEESGCGRSEVYRYGSGDAYDPEFGAEVYYSPKVVKLDSGSILEEWMTPENFGYGLTL